MRPSRDSRDVQGVDGVVGGGSTWAPKGMQRFPETIGGGQSPGSGQSPGGQSPGGQSPGSSLPGGRPGSSSPGGQSPRSPLAWMVDELCVTSSLGSARMLVRAALCLAVGVVLVSGYRTPWWLVPFGVMFEGVSLVWFQLIHKDCERGRFFPSKLLNFLRLEVWTAVALLLTISGTWSVWALFKFWLLPLLVTQATFSTTGSESTEPGRLERRGRSRSKRVPSMSPLDILFPDLKSAAGQINDLLEQAQRADQSNILRRTLSNEADGANDGEDWQFGVAMHQIPMYHLQMLSKNLSQELQRVRPSPSASPTASPSASTAGSPLVSDTSEPDLTRLRNGGASARQRSKERKGRRTPWKELMSLIGWPTRYVFREMWLWSERDVTVYLTVLVFLLEFYIGSRYFFWSPICLLYPLLSSSSGARIAAELQEELVLLLAPEQHSWRRVNVPVATQALVCHGLCAYFVLSQVIFRGVDPYVGTSPKYQTFVCAAALWAVSVVGMVGMNLFWACRTVALSLPQKVALMLCASVANQGSIFHWCRDHRSHLLNVGTEADPYDYARGGWFSYIGWFLQHKTPRAFEASRFVDMTDLLSDQVVMFHVDVDAWWNLSFCHAIPAFVTLLWGENLCLGWLVCGCVRYVLALHTNLLLVRYQHLWGPVPTGVVRVQEAAQAPVKEVAATRSERVAGSPMLPDAAVQKAGDPGSGVFVKYKVGESTGGVASLEVKLEPLWRRSTLVDLAKDAVASILKVDPNAVRPDRPLMDLGFDSASALRLRDKLSSHLKIQLPPTLLFDHPTINDMIDFGLSQFCSRAMTPAPVAAQAHKAPSGPGLVIAATGCAMPQAASLDGLWDMLKNRTDAVVEVPLARWDHFEYYAPEPMEGKTYACHGGFIEGADLFDAPFFGLSPAEAKATDPQQRLLLMTSYYAFQGNGYDKALLPGHHIGVYAALSNLDWYHMSLSKPSVYTGTGVASAIAANRVSYVFGLKGPSMTVDTACSSSLSALTSATAAMSKGPHLRMRESLVAGSEVLHGPNSFVLRSVAGMLSPAGRCKTFNATADGYIRGEGCAAALVKFAPDAEEGRCAVVAEVRSAVMNQDGKSATLTAPNGPSQEEVVLHALEDAQAQPLSVMAVECHGTGTALGDPIEVGALKAVLGNGSDQEPELFLCAGKSNHGHLEGAAGFAGLMKVFGCLQHQEVPPNIHYEVLNPHIGLKGSRLTIPEAQTVLPRGNPMMMGVSSFGFGGTNAHALLQHSKLKAPKTPEDFKVAFLFTGQGSQRLEMGKRLYRADETFKAALDQCAALCKPLLPDDLIDVIFGMEDKLNGTLYSQVSIFAVEYALAQMWRARGVTPHAVLGHSVGEFVAAVYTGVMSLEDGIRMVAARGRLIEEKCDATIGTMVSIFASSEHVKRAIEQTDLKGQVATIAAVNGPLATVVSGHKEAVQAVCASLNANNKRLEIPHAMHSPLTAAILPELRKVVASCRLSRPDSGVRFISTLTGGEVSAELCEVGHWVGHDEDKPMLFLQGMLNLERLGCNAFLEVGPQPVLIKMGRRCVGRDAGRYEWLTSLQPGRDEVENVMLVSRALGAAFGRASELRPVPLPWRPPPQQLPGQREAYPWRVDSARMLQRRAATDKEAHFDCPLRSDLFAVASEHTVYGEIVVPGVVFVEMAMEPARAHLGDDVQLRDVQMVWPLVVPKDGDTDEKQVCMRIAIIGNERFELRSQSPGVGEWTTHCEGRIELSGPGPEKGEAWDVVRQRCPSPVDASAVYPLVASTGLCFGPTFQVLTDILRNPDEISCKMMLAPGVPNSGFIVHPSLFDGTIHALYAAMVDQEEPPLLKIFAGVGRVAVYAKEYWSMLLLGRDMIQEVPIERWDVDLYYDEDHSVPGKMYTRNAGFISGLEGFDSKLFGIGDLEAQAMDPHQRILLEVVYESFWNAGFGKDELLNSETGVFIGCFTMVGGISVPDDDIGSFTMIGAVSCGNSGRVSHALGLRGPCFTIDTACSSTIVALDCAAQAMRLGRCDKSCAAGSNLQLCPRTWVACCKLGALSADGRCKTFDQSADGFTRSEGAGSLILETETGTSRRGGARTCTVRGACVNQDGRSATITAPSGPAQARCISNALQDGSVGALDITMVEVHGTGTALGDPIEMGALKSTVGKGRATGSPVILAAVKSIVGHEEGAAGIAGVVKVVCAMKHKQLPRNLHLATLNPNIDLADFPVIMPDSVIDWRAASTKSGLSSFGFSGTNSHAVMEGLEGAERDAVVFTRAAPPLVWHKTPHRLHDWAKGLWFSLDWRAVALPTVPSPASALPCLLVGGGAFAEALQELLGGAGGCKVVQASSAAAALREQEWATVVFAEALASEDCSLEDGPLNHLVDIVRIVVELGRSLRLVAATAGAQSASGGSMLTGLAGAAVWGLMRAVHWEARQLVLQSVDLAGDPQAMALLLRDELLVDEGAVEPEVAYHDGVRKVPRLVPVHVPQPRVGLKNPRATQVVTGGLGGLGLLAAQTLADLGAQSLLLVSRTGKVAAGEMALLEMLKKLEGSSATVHSWSCDVSDATQVRGLVERAKKELPENPLGGVVHAASILDYADIQSQTHERMAAVFKVKVSEAWFLHNETQHLPLESFVLFSSVSALIGFPRGTSYSPSNAYLDGLALWRRAQGLPATSIQWGPMSEVGTEPKDDLIRADGALRFLKPAQVQAAFRQSLFASALPPCLAFAHADWGRFLREHGARVPVLLDYEGHEAASTKVVSKAGQAFEGLSRDQLEAHVVDLVLQVAAGVLGSDAMSPEAPLMESGLDSLSAVEFRNLVAKQLPGINLPSTLMFDYPTVHAIAAFAANQLAPATAGPPQLRLAPGGAGASEAAEPIALRAGSHRLPIEGETLDAYWDALVSKVNCISEIPLERWDVDAYFDADRQAPGKMYVRHGSFVKGADLFDCSFFGLSPAESRTMDPQQRMLLEVVFRGFHGVGLTKESLSGMAAAVCVGQCNNDWGHLGMATELADNINPYTALAVTMCLSSNRVSYILGLKGPSLTVDTACSSSLMAVDIAASSLRRSRCTVAAAAGVNLNLIPGLFIACSKAQMLSEDGLCKTFDASANGYVRGEGCGAGVLVRLAAMAEGEQALAVIHGTAVNQDGRSASQTAPHGPSQQDVVMTAVMEAGVLPGEVSTSECHGTGTALGDPIETGALKATLGQGRATERPLVLAAGKTNLGHSEGAAGIAGLLKVAAMLPHKQAPANLHLRTLNPYIDLDGFPTLLPAGVADLPGADLSAGLSAFGFGGTNANVLSKEFVGAEAAPLQPAELTYTRQSFAWQSVRHTLLAKRMKTPEGVQVFSAPFAGRLLQLVSHHVMYDKIAVPAATYLEMVLAAGEYFLGGKGTEWYINNMAFQSLLVLKTGDQGQLTQAVDLYLQVFPDGHWAMSSYDVAQQRKAQTHAEGHLEIKGIKSSRPAVDLDAVRRRCDEELDVERLYLPFYKLGLLLQPRLRTARHILRGDDEAIVKVEAENDGTNMGFLFNPAVLDGAFHSSMSLMLARRPAEVDPPLGLRIPVLCQRVTSYAQGHSTSIIVHHVLQESNDKETCVDSKLCREDGVALLGIDALRFREVRPEQVRRLLHQAAGDAEQDVLEVEWAPIESALGQSGPLQGKVLFVGASEAFKDELAKVFPSAAFADGGVDIGEVGRSTVVYVGALAGQAPEMEVLHHAMVLIQAAMAEAAADASNAPAVWLVTRGTQPIGRSSSYTTAGLWGMARTARMEERRLKLRCLDLDDSQGTAEAAAEALLHWLGLLTPVEAEVEVAIRAAESEKAYVSRLTRSNIEVRKPVQLQMSSRGSLLNLRPVPQSNRRPPAADEVELRVRAIGLNFRDVLNVMGMIPGDLGKPGGDCAGTVTSVGAGVTDLRPGHDVFGIAAGCLQTYVTSRALLLVQKPKDWSLEQMAAWPVTFAATEEAFQELAPLARGERVLIHAATGGVGLVAVQFAQRVGATIFATCSPSKADHLRGLGLKYITTTRDGAAFEADMARFLEEDGADNLDCVLHSLGHDDYIPRSLKLLKKGGRFMELGKIGTWNHEQMAQERPDVVYEKIAVDWVMEHDPNRFNGLLRRLVSQIEEGWWAPLPLKVFEGLERGVDALRYLQRAQHIGKVVLAQPSRMACAPDGCYLLSGGLGALGLATAQMLAEEGAKSLVLTSRRGVAGAQVHQAQWQRLQGFAVDLRVKACDAASLDQVQALLAALRGELAEAQPAAQIRGLLHLAAVLEDATLHKLTRGHLERAYGAKVWGARHMHAALASKTAPLDFLILFSSTSALLGSPGQAGDSTANASLDGAARFWQQRGEKAWSIQWGPWREVGQAAQEGAVERPRAQGQGSIGSTVGMAVLCGTLGAASSVVAACPVQWGPYLKQFGRAVPPFLSRFKREALTGQATVSRQEATLSLTPKQVEQLALTIAIEVTGSAEVDANEPLMESGLDSLGAVEFRNRLSSQLPGVNLPSTLIFEYPTVAAIAQFAAAQLGQAAAKGPALSITAEEVERLALAIAIEVSGSTAVDASEPLMESGLDSLGAVEFRNRLSSQLLGFNLPNTLIFDHPTVADIARFAVAQSRPAAAKGAALSISPEQVEQIALATAIEVSGSTAVDANEPLMEAGLDSLAAVEFRNRLSLQLPGVNLPNTLILDHPTVAAIGQFAATQLGQAAAEAASASSLPAATEPARSSVALIESLNSRAAGSPIFFVPGAGMQASCFRALAALLPVPAYGLSWPKGARPREEWPSTMDALAKVFWEEVRKVQPTGPYRFAGHSFGAVVCLVMAKVAEEHGSDVSLVALLDPRHLGGGEVAAIVDRVAAMDLVDTLALLAQAAPDGVARYGQQLEELARVDPAQQDTVARQVLSPAVLASLEHMHETTKWYSTLLSGELRSAEDSPLRGHVVWIRAAESSKDPLPGDTAGHKLARDIQATFQPDSGVAYCVDAWRAEKCAGLAPMKAPGTHFSMLHEPHAVTLALRLCRALEEVEDVAE